MEISLVDGMYDDDYECTGTLEYTVTTAMAQPADASADEYIVDAYGRAHKAPGINLNNICDPTRTTICVLESENGNEWPHGRARLDSVGH